LLTSTAAVTATIAVAALSSSEGAAVEIGAGARPVTTGAAGTAASGFAAVSGLVDALSFGALLAFCAPSALSD
jgi:hypothetical protein